MARSKLARKLEREGRSRTAVFVDLQKTLDDTAHRLKSGDNTVSIELARKICQQQEATLDFWDRNVATIEQECCDVPEMLPELRAAVERERKRFDGNRRNLADVDS